MLPKEKAKIAIQLQYHWFTMVSCLQNKLWEWSHEACRENQPMVYLIWDLLHKIEPLPNASSVINNQRNLWEKPNSTYCSKKKKRRQHIDKKEFLMIFCYSHRSVPCLVVNRESSSCDRWDQIQRPTPDTLQSSMGCLYQISPIRVQGTSSKEETEGGHQNTRTSQSTRIKLVQTEAAHTGTYYVLCMYNIASSWVFLMGFPSLSGSLILMPSLGCFFLYLICPAHLLSEGFCFILL